MVKTHIAFGITLIVAVFGCDARKSPAEKPLASAPATAPATAPEGAVEFEVEAACGECKFGLAGDSCDLAVRIDGKAYFVDGSAIDAHGDAHAADGLCNSIRRAVVSGAVANERFVATSFRVLPKDAK
jgi:Family of unknown function (DUF6370)